MSLIGFIILCVLVGLVVYLVTTFLPIPQQIKTIILIAACVVLVLILLQALGLFDRGFDVRLPRIR